MERHITLAVHVEGLALGGVGAEEGVLFHFGDPAPSIMEDYYWESSLVGAPESIDQIARFMTGEYGVSDAPVKVELTDDNIRLFWRENDPVGLVTADATAVATTIVIQSSVTPVVGGFVYLEDETLRITSVSPAGTTYTLGVTRGWAKSPARAVGAGVPVYLGVPYHAPRPVRMYRIDHAAGTYQRIWLGFLEDVDSDDQQMVTDLMCVDGIGAIAEDQEGFTTSTPFLVSIADLRFDLYGNVRGEIRAGLNSLATVDWVNPNHSTKAIRVGDALVTMEYSGGKLTADNSSKVLHRSDTRSEDVEPDETVQEVFAIDRAKSYSSAEGIYGGKYNAVSVALGLLLSTGNGINNPEDPDNPGSYLDFDIFGAKVGLGLPATLIDMETWKPIIDAGEYLIDQMHLGWNGPFRFAEIAKRALQANGLFMAPSINGPVSLLRYQMWQLGDMAEVMGNQHHSILNSTSIRIRKNEREKKPFVEAEIGGTPWDDPDYQRVKIYEGDRRDTNGLRSAFRFDMAYRRKGNRQDATDQEWRAIRDFLNYQAALRRDHPPTMYIELPEEHQVEVLGQLGGSVPGCGQWVRIRGGPETKVLGPDGVRVDIDTTNIIFIGRIERRTMNLMTGDVKLEVELSNWRSGDISPRGVAPAAKVLSYTLVDGFVIDGSDWPSVTSDNGLTVGDEIEIYQPDARPYFEGEVLTIASISADPDPEIQVTPQPVLTIGDEGFTVRLSNPDDYDNDAWDSAGYFSGDFNYRQFAYLADESGRIGDVRDDRGDYYVEASGPGIATGAPNAIFHPIHPDILSADRPYDTQLLRQIRDRSEYLLGKVGNSYIIHYEGDFGDDPDDYQGVRPYTSVTGWAAHTYVPWRIQPGLKKVIAGMWVRVSNGDLDDDAEGIELPVDLSLRFLTNRAVAQASVLPVLKTPSGGPVWQYIELELTLQDWTNGLRSGFKDYLVVEFLSHIESNLTADDLDGVVDSAAIDSPRRSHRILSGTSNFYDEGSTTAPEPYTNEASCTITSQRNVSTYHVNGLFDHCLSLDSGDTMVVWPNTQKRLVEEADETGIARFIHKSVAAYIQIASIEITEVYDGVSSVLEDDTTSHTPTYARVGAANAGDANLVVSRAELVCGPSAGLKAFDATAIGDAWNDRGYRRRWPQRNGTLTVPRRLIQQEGRVSRPSSKLTLDAVLVGYYDVQSYYEDEDWNETKKKSPLSNVEIQFRAYQLVDGSETLVGDSGVITLNSRAFVVTNKLSSSHALYTQAWLNKEAATEPEGFAYREGLLVLDSLPQAVAALEGVPASNDGGSDTQVLLDDFANIEISLAPNGSFDHRLPIEIRFDVDVLDETSWAEDPGSLPRNSDGLPEVSLMQMALITHAVWSEPAPDVVADEGQHILRQLIQGPDWRTTYNTQEDAWRDWGTAIPLRLNDHEIDSVGYTKDNAAGGEGLERFDIQFKPARPEVMALAAAASDKSIHLVELLTHFSETSPSATIKADFFPSVEAEQAETSADLSLEAGLDSSADGWARAWGILELDTSPPDQVDSFRVRLEAKGAGVAQLVQIREVQTIEARELGTLLAAADIWIGRYADTVDITAWSGFDASEGFASAGNPPTMNRDGVGTHIHSATFGASDVMTASPDIVAGHVYGVLFNVDSSDATERHILEHRRTSGGTTCFRAYVDSSVLYVDTYQGGVTYVTNLGAVSTSTWYDLVVAIQDGMRMIWLDGELVSKEDRGTLTTGKAVAYLGRGNASGTFNGDLAMVDVVGGADWNEFDIARYVYRRRQIHGAY
jgi:hypothetical protein